MRREPMQGPIELVQRAVESFQAGRFDESIQLLNITIPQLPDLTMLRYVKALAFLQLGKREEALATSSELLTLLPGHEEARQIYRSLTGRSWQIKLSALDTAEAHTALRFKNQAESLLEGGRALQAFVCVDKALSFKLTIPGMYYVRGRCLSELGRLEEALVAFKQELVVQPDNEALLSEVRELQIRIAREVDPNMDETTPRLVRKPHSASA